PRERSRCRAVSAEAVRLEIMVGLDDLAQPIFRGPIAAIGIGMMSLDQRLEPGLDLLGRGVRLEAERIERLALGIARRAELRQPPLGSTPCAGQSAELPEHAEGII